MLFEENTPGTAFIVGRFQPITKMHYRIIDEARKKYQQVFVIVVNPLPTPRAKKYTKSGQVRKPVMDKMKKNPFPLNTRIKLIHKAFKGKLDFENIIPAKSGFTPDIVKKLHRYISKEDQKQTFVLLAGSDRVDEYKRQLATELPASVKIKEISRNIDNAENVSATKVRNAIRNNRSDEFEKLTPSGIHDQFDALKGYLMSESVSKFSKKLLNEMVHIEDLDVEEFIDFVKHIYQTEASIKLDGTTALGFGFDEKGFFTGFGRDFKQIKPEKRKYSADQWLERKSIVANPAVSAHTLLEQNQDKFIDLISPDEIVLSEVLFGDKPNSIKYDFGGVNHLVILNNNEVAKALSGEYSVTVDNYVIEGEDTIQTKTITQKWSVGSTPTVSPSEYEIDVASELEELKQFLNDTTEGIKNFDILKMRAAGKKKPLVQKVRKQARDLKLNIKEKLLRDFVRNVRGGEYSPSQGYSHEGIVLKKGNKRTKIIDKNVFTRIHDRDWAPVKAATNIVKQMERDDALQEINKMIKNFDTLYPDIDNITKQRMLNNLKMTKIELKDLQP